MQTRERDTVERAEEWTGAEMKYRNIYVYMYINHISREKTKKIGGRGGERRQ